MLAPSNRPKSRLRRTLSARAKSKGQRAKRLALTSLVLVLCTLLFALSAVALGGFALVRTRAESSSINTLSPWERAGKVFLSPRERGGVSVRSMRERSLRAVTPHPNPLPEGEGKLTAQSLSWLSDRAWLHPSRVGSSPSALGSLPLF